MFNNMKILSLLFLTLLVFSACSGALEESDSVDRMKGIEVTEDESLEISESETEDMLDELGTNDEASPLPDRLEPFPLLESPVTPEPPVF